MRKEISLTLDDRGRSMVFKIREMPASQMESWLMRAGVMLHGADSMLGAQLTGVAGKLGENGVESFNQVSYEQARPLLDELLGCCCRMVEGPHGGFEQKVTMDTVDGYIEDFHTLMTLRREALKLNLGFFEDAAPVTFDFSRTGAADRS